MCSKAPQTPFRVLIFFVVTFWCLKFLSNLCAFYIFSSLQICKCPLLSDEKMKRQRQRLCGRKILTAIFKNTHIIDFVYIRKTTVGLCIYIFHSDQFWRAAKPVLAELIDRLTRWDEREKTQIKERSIERGRGWCKRGGGMISQKTKQNESARN